MRRRSWLWSAVTALVVSALVPATVLAQPSAFVYASANGSASVVGYQADAAGALAALPMPSIGAGTKPAGVVVSPDGTSLYTVSQGDATVAQYTVAPDGSLAPKAPAQVATGPSPLDAAITPDGAHLYVSNQGDGSVSIYAIGAGGLLTPAGSMSAGAGVASLAVSPDGSHLYVADFVGSELAQFAIAADGALVPLSPARVSAGTAPFDVAVSADGRSVYVTDQTNVGSVLQYDVGAGGTLTPKATAAVAAERLPAGIVVGAQGAYVANFGSGSVSQYDIGPGGALVPKATPTVAAGLNPWELALSPDAASLYVSNFGAASISQFDVGAGGALAAKAVAVVASGVRPVGLAVVRAPDVTPPSIDLRAPAEGAVVERGADVPADYACSDDGGSGLTACAGTVPDGAPIDTSHVGSFTFSVVARDGAGHETTVTHTYRVEQPPFAWGGFRRPLSDPPRLNVADAGDEIAIRFTLGGFQGFDILAAGSPSYARVDCDDPSDQIGPTRPAKSALHPRVRFGLGTYRFVWDTKTFWAQTCRRLTLTLADGTSHDLLFRLGSPGSTRVWRVAIARARAAKARAARAERAAISRR